LSLIFCNENINTEKPSNKSTNLNGNEDDKETYSFVFTHADGTQTPVTVKSINDEFPQFVLDKLKKDAESFSNPIARDKYSSIKTKKDLDDFIE